MEWISIKDRLPEETVRVVCWVNNEETPRWSTYQIGMFENEKWYLNGGRKHYEIVTHWIPLLEPPK